jgi:murein DD-endopeptidase MepM/ murein hydrolase activator NlpD
MLLLGLVTGSLAVADTQTKLDERRAELQRAKELEGVQTARLAEFSAAVERLTGEVASLRNREAAAEAELAEVEDVLRAERRSLRIARERLRRTLSSLRDQIVSFYKAGDPSVVNVILDANGFDDLLGRSEYLNALQGRTEEVAAQVRELRDETAEKVERIADARQGIAAREAELERTRVSLQQREAALQRAREREQAALEETRTRIGSLSDDVGRLEERVQKELQAAQAVTSVPAMPAAPASSSSGQMIWPVDGTLTSSFGTRWGRAHEGLDIAVPEGTPIRAAAAGTVVLAQGEAESGGYGNFTCLDHGGGLSTCYAHQSSIGATVGETVEQGEVIGASGNTGNSTGPHLHFETRVNGVAQDPLGYL